MFVEINSQIFIVMINKQKQMEAKKKRCAVCPWTKNIHAFFNTAVTLYGYSDYKLG